MLRAGVRLGIPSQQGQGSGMLWAGIRLGIWSQNEQGSGISLGIPSQQGQGSGTLGAAPGPGSMPSLAPLARPWAAEPRDQCGVKELRLWTGGFYSFLPTQPRLCGLPAIAN